MARPAQDEKTRMEKFIARGEGCHEWRGVVKPDGYGRFYFRGRQEPAHRASYELFVGPVGGSYVLHRCDNRRCVNPAHLFLGSQLDNVRDMYAKGREHSTRGLSDDEVGLAYAYAPYLTQAAIATGLGIFQTTVSRVLRRQQNYVQSISLGA